MQAAVNAPPPPAAKARASDGADARVVIHGVTWGRYVAIRELVVSSGGIDKLAIYRGLDVPEVWFFEAGAFTVHRLGPDGYVAGERSALLPTLDLAHLATFGDRADQTAAVRAFLDSLPGA